MAMTIGMSFPRECPASAVTEFAQRLEAGGIDELWLVEDCFFTTAPPLAAAALATTEQLTVGLGILPAVARTAAITAMEIATLASLAPGRVVGGIGHGIQSWMAQMGVATASPLTTLDEVISTVRRLLRGETVTFQGREVTLDEVRLTHVPDPVPAVLAGVGGPKSLALAGRVADGVILGGPSTVPHCRAARQAGKDRESDWQLETFVTMAVAADARDAYRQMAPTVAEHLASVGFRTCRSSTSCAGVTSPMGSTASSACRATGWLQIGAIGTRDDAVEHLALLEAAGVTGAAFFPAPDLETAREQIDDVVAIAAAC